MSIDTSPEAFAKYQAVAIAVIDAMGGLEETEETIDLISRLYTQALPPQGRPVTTQALTLQKLRAGLQNAIRLSENNMSSSHSITHDDGDEDYALHSYTDQPQQVDGSFLDEQKEALLVEDEVSRLLSFGEAIKRYNGYFLNAATPLGDTLSKVSEKFDAAMKQAGLRSISLPPQR